MSDGLSLSPAASRMAPVRLAIWFACGFVAVLVFHQGMLAFLHAIGVAPHGAFPVQPTSPFGVPKVWSLAFWGGVWGIVFGWAAPKFPAGAPYWIAALLFGAIFPTFFAWFVVAPLKGAPVAAGFHLPGLLIGPLVNGAWGLGTAILFAVADRASAKTGPRTL